MSQLSAGRSSVIIWRVTSGLITIVWGLTVVGALKTAWMYVWPVLPLTPTAPAGPWASTDEMLAGFGIGSSAEILGTLNGLPSGAIVIVTPGDQPP